MTSTCYSLVIASYLSMVTVEAGQAPHDTRTASVTLRVTDPFGNPVGPQDTHISLRPVLFPEKDYGRSFHSHYATGIPYDMYSLHVSANALSGVERLIDVNRPEVTITVGLFIRVVEKMENLSILSGEVTPAPSRAGLLAVRLVGVYGEYTNDGLVDEAGHYEIGDVPFGSFLLLVMDRDRIVDSRRFNSGVCLGTRRCAVDIQLPGKPIY